MILGVDYGKKYVGLAVADRDLKIAVPYKVLENKDKEFLFSRLKEIIKKEKIKQIVVGRPIGMSGKLTQQTRLVDKFIQELKEKIKVLATGFDERLTSKMALRTATSKKDAHMVVAAIILEDYLKCKI